MVNTKFNTMINTNSQILNAVDGIKDDVWLVSILELIVSKIDIDTISGMARSEGKTPRGVKVSKKYRKVNIGSAKLAVKGVKNLN
jgi:hypothetical protein